VIFIENFEVGLRRREEYR